MTRRFHCDRPMGVRFEWDRDVWRCEVCGEVQARDVHSSLDERTIELMDALFTGGNAERESVEKLFADHPNPHTLRAISGAYAAGRRYAASAGSRSGGAIAGAAFCGLAACISIAVLKGSTSGGETVPCLGLIVPAGLGVAALRLLGVGMTFQSTPRKRIAEATSWLLDLMNRCDDPAAAGALALAWRTQGLGLGVESTLRKLLTVFNADIAAGMAVPDLEAMTALLAPQNPSPQPESLAALCHALSFTAFEPALAPLDDMATGSAWDGAPENVREAAKRAAAAIRRRIEERAESPTLLRPAEASDEDGNSLLRPAGPGEEPTDQLLRPGDTE